MSCGWWSGRNAFHEPSSVLCGVDEEAGGAEGRRTLPSRVAAGKDDVVPMVQSITHALAPLLRARWEPLATTSVTVDTASVYYQGLPPLYRAFRVTVNLVPPRSCNTLALRFNNDQMSNYEYTQVGRNGCAGRETPLTHQSALLLPTFASTAPSQLTILVAKRGAGSPAQVVAAHRIDALRAPSRISEGMVGEWDNHISLIERIDVMALDGMLPAGVTVRVDGAASSSG